MKIFFTILLMATTLLSFGQDDRNCFDKYEDKFEERGAFDVEDGWYEDVIITFRKGNNAECLYGKAKVVDGVVTLIYLKYADGTYEEHPINKRFKHYEAPKIVNGISKSLITEENEVINVIFVKSIKPPKKEYSAAPNPDDL